MQVQDYYIGKGLCFTKFQCEQSKPQIARAAWRLFCRLKVLSVLWNDPALTKFIFFAFSLVTIKLWSVPCPFCCHDYRSQYCRPSWKKLSLWRWFGDDNFSRFSEPIDSFPTSHVFFVRKQLWQCSIGELLELLVPLLLVEQLSNFLNLSCLLRLVCSP